MKALTEVFDPGELRRITELLHSKGIPTISEGMGTWRGKYRRLVMVCLDDQFDDAVTILKFPSHTPKLQVSVDAFFRRSSGRNMETISSWLAWAVVLLVAAFIVLFKVMT